MFTLNTVTSLRLSCAINDAKPQAKNSGSNNDVFCYVMSDVIGSEDAIIQSLFTSTVNYVYYKHAFKKVMDITNCF